MARGIERFIDLAAVNKHHVAGTAYHWKHGYIPLDRATALANRKGALAKKLFGAGAKHWNLEPGQHELGLSPVEKVKPKEAMPPTAPKPSEPETGEFSVQGKKVTKAVYIKSLQKSVREQGGYHKISDGKLEHLARLGDERAALHVKVRQQIEERDQAIRDNINRALARHKSGEQPFHPYGGASTPEEYAAQRIAAHEQLYTRANKQDLEKREVAATLSNQRRIEKQYADRQAREAARAKREDPEQAAKLQKFLDDATEKYGRNDYQWPPEVLQQAIDLGADKHGVLNYVNKREAKRTRAEAERSRQAAAYASVSKQGDPVSKSINIPKASNVINDGARRALAAIDKVHSDGELVPIPLKKSNARGFYGRYSWHANNPAADNIALSTEGDHQATTMAHEVGHWLDHIPLHSDAGTDRPVNRRVHYMSTRAALHSPTFSMLGATRSDAGDVPTTWQNWWKAISDSTEIKELRDRERTGKGGYRMSGRVQGSGLTYAGYMLQPHEQWARAYAQYIATRSGDPKMQSEIKDLVSLRGSKDNDLQGFSQWTPEEFEPIAKAIDAIIAEKGWKK